MKTCRSFALAFIALFCAVTVSAQTADEIIGKYIQAIGGKDFINKITSVYYESTYEAMGTMGPVKMTTLNGKGMKQEVDIMGSPMITCYTDKGGWSTNPMAGITTPEDMTEAQYKAGKDQIVIEAPFINYAENGSKVELLGNELVGDVNAYKIKLTTRDSTTSLFFFDPNTYYLVKSVQESDMQGQMIENIMTYSDYKITDGYAMPYKMNMDMGGGQFTMTLTVDTVKLNVPVNDSIFIKPQ